MRFEPATFHCSWIVQSLRRIWITRISIWTFFPQDDETNEHIFYLKGADVVMASKVVHNDWLEEEAGELARDGFRTLVVAKKILTPEEYSEFEVSSTSPQFSSKPRRN